MGLLFTPGAIIAGETVLCFPIIVAFAISTTQAINPLVRQTALTLGASPFQASLAVFFEGRIGYLVCVAAGFARVIAEVGAAMMLGGNIKGHTRTLTTAIALETGKGEFSLGMALGIILLVLALAVNIPIQRLKRVGDAS
jgi:tungstate transport system permease protein